MVTANKGQESVTQNISFFKRYHQASVSEEGCDTLTVPDSDGENTAKDLVCTPGSERVTTRGDLQEENMLHPGSPPDVREKNDPQENTGQTVFDEAVVSAPLRARAGRYGLRPHPV
ncbi:hypothetical protein NDU88_006379 [Pleurodeles waltl]|uniref:Uncharacterized protein n=1 Tax=Pleurodeles waltl TaxID=8319 RepID=A0AAV7UKU2_PLEWA|nr:hypothetical protein NDU88_006379 [Pleurodeles waltl]